MPRRQKLIKKPVKDHRRHKLFQKDRNRGEPGRAWYKHPAWKSLRRQVLDEEPVCAICGDERSTVVDHREPHKWDWEMFLDRDNLQGLCKQCHDRKTVTKDGGFGNAPSNKGVRIGCGPDGVPFDPGHPWSKVEE